MKHRLIRLFVVMMKLLVWFLALGLYFVLLSFNSPHLLKFNRTSLIVFLVFSIVYSLMTHIYGGYEIGIRKSRPIIYSVCLDVFFSDIAAHAFLCIMNYTRFNHGRLVIESPLLLLLCFILQCLLITILTYAGNHIFFSVEKPQRTLVVTDHGCNSASVIAQIKRYKKQYQISQIVCFDSPDIFDLIHEHDTVFLVNLTVAQRTPLEEYCFECSKDVYYTFELSDIMATGGKQVRFEDISLMYAPKEKILMEQRIIKRAMDIVISLLALILLSPLMLITSAAIKIEDGGSIFYRQKRATYGGRVFEIYKFRSMKQNVGSIHKSVTSNDSRITKVGKIIRKYRIDEIPQLINVLKSDMSIVGPRPEMVENMEKYCSELPEFSYRLRAKAGITGLAQVYGKYNTTPKDKLILDLLYIENFSILEDIKIIFRTILVLFTPDESTQAFSAKDDQRHDKM